MCSVTNTLSSPLAEVIEDFLVHKRSIGYRYNSEEALLRRLDRFLIAEGHDQRTLPRHQVERWVARRPHERPRNQNARVSIVRQLARFMLDQEMEGYVLPAGVGGVVRLDFTPYIFSRDEVGRLLAAADRLSPKPISPRRHLVMPEIFRLLYGCGMRVGEVLRLTVDDVDLQGGVLRIREGKFRKDRFVPVAPSMLTHLRSLHEALGERPAQCLFFPGPRGRHYDQRAVYDIFRRLLRETSIPHGGRGHGPRLHDLRHTFAVHRLENWIRDGVDLQARLPVLATYMGHQSLAGTQRYLRITPYVFPNIVADLQKVVGYAIPTEVHS